MFPLQQIAHVGVWPNRSLKLFDREIVFEVFQPVWKKHTYVTDRQTDRQTDRRTDGQTTCCRMTALCVASRGKNIKTVLERLEKIHFRVSN